MTRGGAVQAFEAALTDTHAAYVSAGEQLQGLLAKAKPRDAPRQRFSLDILQSLA